MRNKIITTLLTVILLASQVNIANANSPGVRGDIPSVGTENRDLTFRMKPGFLESAANPLQVTFRTAISDESGNPFSISYSEEAGNLFIAKKRRKATLVLPFVESDTRGELLICGGRVNCAEPYVFPLLILQDFLLTVIPNDPNTLIPDEFGNSPIGAVQGPQGPAGPQGPTGPQGPQGPPGTSSGGLVIGGTVDVNGLSTINIGSNNYLTLTDSNTATTEILETITGGSRGQVIFLELAEYVRFRVNNSGTPNTIHWGRGTSTNDIQPTSPSSNYRLLELLHNGTHWLLVGRTNG
jgi:hypothetical protein